MIDRANNVEDLISSGIMESEELRRQAQEAMASANNAADRSAASKILGEAAETAGKSMKKKTLVRSMIDNVKNAKEATGKGIGTIFGAMMAIGMANNVINTFGHSKKDTPGPLSPEHSNSNTSPTYDDESMLAPSSNKRVVYADKGSGLTFNVSAKTKYQINAMNNANLVRMGGGGNANVYTQNDTSGVTDNWLENKFAELM
jgi:hypothetical protein